MEWLSDVELMALSLSLQVAVSATVIGLPIAVWLAHKLATSNFRGKWLVDLLVHLPLVVPPVVVGYLLLLLFAPSSLLGGWLDSLGIPLAFHWRGAALAATVMAMPLMVRMIRLAFESERPALIESSALLGLSRRQHFWRISLPMIKPAVLGAAVIGFARAMGEFGATITFAANIPGVSQTLPLALYSATSDPAGDALAIRLLIISLIPAILAIGFGEWLAQRSRRRAGAAQ